MVLLILLACHFLGDFGFRPQAFEEKDKSWTILALHALTYAAAFVIFAKVGWLVALILFASHIVIDPLLKGSELLKWHPYDSVFIDQGLHLTVIFFIYFFLL